MKKLLLVVAAIALTITLSACGSKQTTLTIFQNKVEIDDALRTYATAWGEKNGVNVEVKTCGGDNCAYGTQILSEFQGSTVDQPDIFVIEGTGGYNQYKDKILDLTGEQWISDTSLAFQQDGKTYGFPVSVEGWGMAYNKTILEDAFALEGQGRTIDSLKTVSQADYAAVFQAVQNLYDSDPTKYAGYAVVSMTAGPGMEWVTGLHNFNGYLSAGLAYNDSTVIDKLNNGQVDADRLNQLANWVELLFDYTPQDLLLTGTYDDQVGLFADGKAAFLHQGNWTDSSYADSTFEMGYLPHATMTTGNDSIFIGAPSYYVINKDADNISEAKQFLNDLALTSDGADYMVNKANMVPAFNSITLQPSTPLSQSLMQWMQDGKKYAWWQNDMPVNFGMQTLGPIYQLYAKGVKDQSGGITKAEFISQITSAIQGLAS